MPRVFMFFKQSEITLFKLISKRGTGEFSLTYDFYQLLKQEVLNG